MCTIQWTIRLGLFWQIATVVRRVFMFTEKTIQIVMMWHLSLPNKHLENRICRSGHLSLWCWCVKHCYCTSIWINCADLQYMIILWSCFLCSSVPFTVKQEELRWTSFWLCQCLFFLHLYAFCDLPQQINSWAACSGSSYISGKTARWKRRKILFWSSTFTHQTAGIWNGDWRGTGDWLACFQSAEDVSILGKKEREEKMSFFFFYIYISKYASQRVDP